MASQFRIFNYCIVRLFVIFFFFLDLWNAKIVKYCTTNVVSSPEYEATRQPESKMECDKEFLGEIILKQIQSNLIPKIFESFKVCDWVNF
jgi:hypothetical protein